MVKKVTQKLRVIMSGGFKGYIFIGIICFALLGCATAISSIEEEEAVEFKVNDPNASYFDVKERMKFLKRHNMSKWSKVKWYGYDCTKLPKHEPVDYYLVMPAYYEDRDGWAKAYAPLEIFEHHVTHMAELYVTRDDNSYAKCLAKTLSDWAKKDSLLSFDYRGNGKQAWYAIEWATSSAAMAYSIIKDDPSIESETKQNIENWLRKVAKKQISYPGGPTSCCNNHSYWRGLEAAITGVVTNDNYLFRFGIAKYIHAIKAMNKNGSFPLEMKRGKRALRYQNFAILPLVYIAEIAARQGYDLYGISIDGKNIHLPINFLINCLQENNIEKGCPTRWQDTLTIPRNVNWMEPYNRRFKNKDIETYMKFRRPFYHVWGGGNSTLYFYSPEIK